MHNPPGDPSGGNLSLLVDAVVTFLLGAVGRFVAMPDERRNPFADRTRIVTELVMGGGAALLGGGMALHFGLHPMLCMGVSFGSGYWGMKTISYLLYRQYVNKAVPAETRDGSPKP